MLMGQNPGTRILSFLFPKSELLNGVYSLYSSAFFLFLCRCHDVTSHPQQHPDGLWDAAEHHSAVLAKDLVTKDFERKNPRDFTVRTMKNQRF